MKKVNLKKGIGLVEVIIAVSILAVTLAAILTSFRIYVRAALNNTETIKAAFLAEEGMEALRFMRDSSWSTNIAPLVNGTPYYFNFSTSTKVWSLTTASSTIDNKYERVLTVAAVSRDANDDIAASGTLDSNMKFATVKVTWFLGNATTTLTLKGYLSNLFE